MLWLMWCASIKRTPQVRYTHKFTPNTNLVAAVEDPKDASMSQRMPAFTGRLNHKFNDATFSQWACNGA